MKQIKIIILLLTISIFSMPVFAKADEIPRASLADFDDKYELEIFRSTGEYVDNFTKGMDLPVGTTIKTYNSTAEIQLLPNKSIIKLSRNTVIKIEELQSAPREINGFSLFSGKIRVVTATGDAREENYLIVTQSTACAAKAADFVLDSMGVLTVKDGDADFINLINGQRINVNEGQMADTQSNPFQPIPVDSSTINSIFSDMYFKKLTEKKVPGDIRSSNSADSRKTTNTNTSTSSTITSRDNDRDYSDVEDEPAPKFSSNSKLLNGNNLLDSDNRDILENVNKKSVDSVDDRNFKLEVTCGVMNANDTLFAKLIAQPVYDSDIFKAKLYLPIVFNNDLLNPDGWFQASANNEWSFGMDQDGDSTALLLDLYEDITLKIDYLQLGAYEKMFYLKIGTIEDTTFGHGLLINEFNNNLLFQNNRYIGADFKLDFGRFAFQALLDSITHPSIFGMRMDIIPLGEEYPIDFGFTLVADMYPGAGAEDNGITFLFDPIIYSGSFDLTIPITSLNMNFFTEFGGVTIFKDNEFHTNTIFDTEKADFVSSLNNYGVKAGIDGSIGNFFNYEIDYNLTKGAFYSSAYDDKYFQSKKIQSDNLNEFIETPDDESFQKNNMSIYGEMGFNFFDAVKLSGAYTFPLVFDGTEVDDNLEIILEIYPDIIPYFGLYGTLLYSYTGFLNNMSNADFSFTDSNSIIEGELIFKASSSYEVIFKFTNYLNDNDITPEEETEESIINDFSISLEMRVTM